SPAAACRLPGALGGLESSGPLAAAEHRTPESVLGRVDLDDGSVRDREPGWRRRALDRHAVTAQRHVLARREDPELHAVPVPRVVDLRRGPCEAIPEAHPAAFPSLLRPTASG